MDHGVLDVLGPQLIRGKKIKLAQAMKAAPEGWAVKYVLMNQLVHERERRFAVPESECERPAQPSGRGGWRLPESVLLPCHRPGRERCHRGGSVARERPPPLT